jgi:hypothetical protein
MRLEESSAYSREELLRDFKGLRYVRDNQTYFLCLILHRRSCLYVGETSNIFWRIAKLQDKCSEESVIYLQEYSDKETVLKLEKHYIRILKPMFNNRYCMINQVELYGLWL